MVVSYEVDPDNPNNAIYTSRRLIFEVEQSHPFYNGGQLSFGPDGYLYLSLRDGGESENAQDLSNFLGSILRLDVSNPTTDLPYTIPPDNPFLETPDALQKSGH